MPWRCNTDSELALQTYTSAQVGQRITWRLQAELFRFDPTEAQATHERNLRRLREHLTKRREFLLAQPEVKSAGRFSHDGL